MIVAYLIIANCVLVATLVVLTLLVVEQRNEARSIEASHHDACIWRIAGVVDAAHAADVLERAAHDWESVEEQGRLRTLANTKYQVGGPSMPSIWLQDRADRYRGAALPGHPTKTGVKA